VTCNSVNVELDIPTQIGVSPQSGQVISDIGVIDEVNGLTQTFVLQLGLGKLGYVTRETPD
jgi:hypothetical protein